MAKASHLLPQCIPEKLVFETIYNLARGHILPIRTLPLIEVFGSSATRFKGRSFKYENRKTGSIARYSLDLSELRLHLT